jgi:hypothetical protein
MLHHGGHRIVFGVRLQKIHLESTVLFIGGSFISFGTKISETLRYCL